MLLRHPLPVESIYLDSGKGLRQLRCLQHMCKSASPHNASASDEQLYPKERANGIESKHDFQLRESSKSNNTFILARIFFSKR